ncbi:MAG: hypothetical protein WC845_00755 [Candidatus Staskawiczbacteria bacterium]|jgi:hypothetical protein
MFRNKIIVLTILALVFANFYCVGAAAASTTFHQEMDEGVIELLSGMDSGIADKQCVPSQENGQKPTENKQHGNGYSLCCKDNSPYRIGTISKTETSNDKTVFSTAAIIPDSQSIRGYFSAYLYQISFLPPPEASSLRSVVKIE